MTSKRWQHHNKFVVPNKFFLILARYIENYWMVPFALSLYLVQIIISR
jgi:hypothetical protein